MNENEKKLLKKKAALQCRLGYINEEINRLEEEITLSEKEKKNREHITLEKELEEIKREIPNFSEDVYKQYKRYFETEMKINNIAENEEVKIKYLKEKLVYEQKIIMAELEKIDNELTYLTKEEISK